MLPHDCIVWQVLKSTQHPINLFSCIKKYSTLIIVIYLLLLLITRCNSAVAETMILEYKPLCYPFHFLLQQFVWD